jgi:cobalt-zinc-cadmium efflux system membrane fusion protein
MDQPDHMLDTKPAPPPAVRHLSRKAQIVVLAVVAVIAVTAFVLGPKTLELVTGGPKEETAAATPEAAGDGTSFKPTDRQWAALKIKQIDNGVFQDAATTDGKIAIDDDLVTSVYSPYTGHVTRLIARPGDFVKRGDPLFAMDASELAQGQNDLISAVATLRTVRAQLLLAETNEKRQHALYLAQGAALKDWQQSQVDLATAQGGIATASIAVSAVRSRLRILGISVADIAALEASPDLLTVQADTPVRSPIDGTVTQRQIGLGQNIVSAASGGSNAVYMVGDLSKVWLVANAREEDAPVLHIGDRAQVTVLAFPGRVFDAKITYVGSSIDPNTHRLPVRAEVDNPKGELKPEMLAGFRIIVGEDAEAPAVPSDAVVYEGETAHVWVADPATKALAIRQVVTGRMRNGVVEILKGLKTGESVVTQGAVFIDRAAASD